MRLREIAIVRFASACIPRGFPYLVSRKCARISKPCAKSSIAFVLVSIDRLAYTHRQFVPSCIAIASHARQHWRTACLCVSDGKITFVPFGGHSRPGRQLILNVLDDPGDRHRVVREHRRVQRRGQHRDVALHEYLLQNWKNDESFLVTLRAFEGKRQTPSIRDELEGVFHLMIQMSVFLGIK